MCMLSVKIFQLQKSAYWSPPVIQPMLLPCWTVCPHTEVARPLRTPLMVDAVLTEVAAAARACSAPSGVSAEALHFMYGFTVATLAR